jgi:polyisoprenoid-binding protein YceI
MRRILCVSAFAFVLAPMLALAADFPLTGENTTVKFVGSKPKGKHDGGFKKVSGKATVDGGDVTTLKITLDIETDSIYSDVGKLTDHLKGPDFFNVKENPKSTFASTKVEKDGDNYKITGDLTLLGKTKSITFPATVAVAKDGLTLSSSFTIDRTQWGMTYKSAEINKDVKLTVNIKTAK